MGLNTTRADCYHGIFGVCGQCDADGSCICPAYASARSDMVAMDRTEYGGRVLLCPTISALVGALYTLGLVLALGVSLRTVTAIGTQLGVAREAKRRWWQHLPLVVLYEIVMCNAFTAALCLTKLLDPSLLLGLHLLPSALFALFKASCCLVAMTNFLHMYTTAIGTQETTLGRTRVNDAVQREARVLLVQGLLGSAVNSVPLVGAVVAQWGVDSTWTEVGLLLLLHVGDALITLLYLLVLWHRHREMVASFERSIEALQASMDTLYGGVSMRAALGSGSGDGQGASVHAWQLEQEVSGLETAKGKVQSLTTEILVAFSALGVVFTLFAAVPWLWNKASYLFAAQCVWFPVGLSNSLSGSYMGSRSTVDCLRAATGSRRRVGVERVQLSHEEVFNSANSSNPL